MAKLVIKRSSEWTNRIRGIKIYIDNDLVGKIDNGETKSFDIDAGTHTVRAKIDWCGSQTMDFEVKEDDIQMVRLSAYKYASWNIVLLLIIFFVIKFCEDFFKTQLPVYFMIPFALYSLYFLTIGRNHYLRLEKDGIIV